MKDDTMDFDYVDKTDGDNPGPLRCIFINS